MEQKKFVGILLVALLAAALAGAVVWLGKPKNPSGLATGPYQGFNSYEEMMEAHHGTQAAKDSGGSCGGVPSQSHSGVAVAQGQQSDYGITYDSAGYAQLLDAAKTVSLTSAQANEVVGLDVEIPCCGFKTLQASGNCECGHHVALYGLAKLLASKGYTKAQIQPEINKWKAVFYPENSSGNTGGC